MMDEGLRVLLWRECLRLGMCFDGDHRPNPSNPSPTVMQGSHTTKEAKEVQAMVRNFISNDLHQLSSSNSFWPGFVSLTECNSEGQISCTHDQIKS